MTLRGDPHEPMTDTRANRQTITAPTDVVEWYCLSANEAHRLMGTPKEGLSEDMVAQRREAFGQNALPQPAQPGIVARIFAQINNALIYVLLGAAAITGLLGHWTDVWIILGVVVANAAIGLWQEGKAEDALAAVRNMLTPNALAIRAGKSHKVPAQDLVPGDLVLLEAGDQVPADLRILDSRGVRAEEAALTGEAVAVEKSPQAVPTGTALGSRSSMLFAGTMIVSGRATGLVVATGEETEIGQIGAMLNDIEAGTTPLLETMDRFAKGLTVAVLLLCGAGFATAIGLRGYTVEEAFFAMVGMAVAAIPEGLPAVITITLALGVQRLAKGNAIVRKLPAVETLGAVSVICTDKTGTLTRNEMVARTLHPAELQRTIELTGDGYAPEGELLCDDQDVESSRTLVETALLTSEAELNRDPDTGAWRANGDPMDAAIVALTHKAAPDLIQTHKALLRLDDLPFDSANRFNALLSDHPETGRQIHVKGAPERILAMCDHEASTNGADPVDPDNWVAQIEIMAKQGQRVLAFARKPAERSDALDIGQDFNCGFEFLGLVGFVDPLRSEARTAVAECWAAGIGVTMITGDHAGTAQAIARDLGIGADGETMTGADIDALDDAALQVCVREVSVFARAAPSHKLRLIAALRQDRSVIAMTGDGVNDAPALKQADVGVAMGIKGTEVAKSSAELVLADDNFASIAAAVREGRVIYDNIRKVIAWTLPTNVGEALIIAAAVLLGATLPLEATHILWINMVTAVTLGLTLAFDPAEPGIMRRAPRRPEDPIIDRLMLWQMVLVAGIMAISAYAVFHLALTRGDDLTYARTLVVHMIVLVEIAYLISIRSSAPFVSVALLFRTWPVPIGIAVALLAQVIFAYLPFMQGVFGTQATSASDLGLLGITAIAIFVLLEIEKYLRVGVQHVFSSVRRKV